MKTKALFLVMLFLLLLTGCQPDPVPADRVEMDFPLNTKTIQVDDVSHTLSLSDFEITSSSAENKSETVYCSYTLSDGSYSLSGEYSLSYEYRNRQWELIGAWETVEPTVSVSSNNPPGEALTEFDSWVNHFKSSLTVNQVSEYEKISDTQFDANYTVTESNELLDTSTDYLLRATLKSWSTDGNSFYWESEQGEGETKEIWKLEGNYEFKNDREYISFHIDSYDPETMVLKLSNVKRIYYAYFPGETDTVKEASEITCQMQEYSSTSGKYPLKVKSNSNSEIPLFIEIYVNRVCEYNRPMEKTS